MKVRTTLILASILVLLVGFYYIYDVKMAGKKEEKKNQEDRVLPFEVKTAENFTIKKEKVTISFDKKDGSWHMTTPETKLASSTIIDGFLGMLHDMKKEKVLEENPADLVPFGLKPPETELTVRASEKEGDPAREFTLLLGSRTPSGSSYYAQIPGKPALFTIPSTISTELDKKATEYREMNALPLDPARTTKVILDYGERTLTLENPQDIWTYLQKEPRWTVISSREKEPEKGDGGKISTFLWEINNMKAQKFLGDTDPLYGRVKSGKPLLRVTVEQAEKNPETLTVMAGDGKSNELVAKREQSGEIFTVKEDDIKKLSRDMADFRNMKLLSFDPRDIGTIDIKTGSLDIAAKKTDDGWKITKPGGIRKAMPSIDSIMWKLESTQFQEKLESDRNFAAQSDAVITIKEKNGANPVTIELKKDPKGEKKCGVVLKGGAAGFYTISDDLLLQVQSVADDIRKALEKPKKDKGKGASPSPGGSMAPGSPPPSPAGTPSSPAQSPGWKKLDFPPAAPSPAPSVRK